MTACFITIPLIAIYIIDNEALNETWRLVLGVPLLLFILSGMMLTFIDFITLGWLKRKKWISKIYFPIYWVFSFLTLSFLYRPLVYNFLDNKLGKRISYMLLPLFVLLIFASSLRDGKSNYFSESMSFNSSSYYGNPLDYEDQLKEKDELTETASIQSKIISDPFLKIFITLTTHIDDHVFAFNPELKPETDARGIKSMAFVGDVKWNAINKKRKQYLHTFNEIYLIEIDSVRIPAEFIVGHNIQKQLGFETYIGTKHLNPGKHMLYIKRKRIRDQDTIYTQVRSIPFWYYAD
jgi:hypothetical protein